MDHETKRILDMRLVNGEITQEEYEAKLAILQSHEAPVFPATHGFSPPPPPPPPNPLMPPVVPPPPGVPYLNKQFFLWMVLGSQILGFLLFFFAGVAIGVNGPYYSDDETAGIVVLFLFAFLAYVPSIVFTMILLHKCWRVLQPYGATTTPGQAVGFLFIPFFNLYWQFIAYWKLLVDFNRVSVQHGRVDLNLPEGLAVAYCVLACVCVVPYANCLAGLGLAVILPIYVYMLSDRVNRFVTGT